MKNHSLSGTALLHMTPDYTTPAGKRVALKPHLHDTCLPDLAAQSPYFSLDDVRASLRARRAVCSPALLRGYLSGFMRTGVIHNAGR